IYKVQKKDALAKADEAKEKKFGATAAIDTSLLLSSPEAAYRKAYEQLTQIIKEHPAEMHPYNERAFLSLNAKYYKAAIEDFNVILKKTPQDVKALLGRGQCYFFLSDYASAGDDFDKALAVDPQKSYAAHTWKARIKEKLSPREDHSGVRAD
ncbi:MAG TPA: tetratricopeptide repeat protein, partial [Candidatus Obscuribacter sp.]|nr:tetratricopeptide repeat protein [Candidatus Obscuribacter sp.]